MALLNKLFSPKKVDKQITRDLKQDSASFRPFAIQKEDIRILLFKDCDRSGRRLLFDSSTVEKIPIDCSNKTFESEFSKFCGKSQDASWENAIPYIVEVSNGFAYRYLPAANDAGWLGEMIFGTVAMNYHGVSLKFHILNEPQRLVCAKVYGIPVKASNHYAKSESCISASDLPSVSPQRSQWPSLTLPLNTPPVKSDSGYSLSFSFGRADSGFYCGRSSESSVSSSYMHDGIFDIWDKEHSHDDLYYAKTLASTPTPQLTGNGSFNRRLQRNISTKLDSQLCLGVPQQTNSQSLFNANTDPKLHPSLSAHTTTDSLLSYGSSTSGSTNRRITLGLAIIVSLAEKLETEMLRYFLQHSPQLEAMLMRLAAAATTAVMHRSKRKTSGGFVSSMVTAADDIIQALSDLVSSPRIPSLWLNLMSIKEDNKEKIGILHEKFMKNLSFVLSTADTKDTNFFISTLMTSILTHHLGWVATVSPYEVNSCTIEDSWNILTIQHPYNPLWAQLGDLYGAVGTPLKTSRTIVCGANNSHLVSILLSILTYFIRCGKVHMHLFEQCNSCTKDQETSLSTSVSLSMSNDNKIDFNDNIETNITTNSKNASGLKRSHHFTAKLDSLENIDDICKTENLVSYFMSESTNIINPESKVCLSTTKEHANKGLYRSPTKNELPLSCIERRSNVVSPSLCTDLGTIDEEFYRETTSTDKPFDDNVSTGVNVKMNDELCENANRSVLFVLGDNEQLIGLKNKIKCKDTVLENNASANNKCKILSNNNLNHIECNIVPSISQVGNKISCLPLSASSYNSLQSCQHNKSKKHSGVKFEFDKYPQIVTNYLKSKNLEWLNRDYIGKPGNIKINGFDFDSSTNLTLMEEEIQCDLCHQRHSAGFPLQTPSNASELEFTCDLPKENDYQHAKENIVSLEEVSLNDVTQKTFTRHCLENTLIINVVPPESKITCKCDSIEGCEKNIMDYENISLNASEDDIYKEVTFIELPFIKSKSDVINNKFLENSFDCTLLGDVSDHYIPDMVLQGILSSPEDIELAVRREISFCSQTGLPLDQGPNQAIAIVADTQQWCVQVWGSSGSSYAGVFSPLVASIFDVLPIMIQSKTPPHQCISYIESKLRELCTRSKTLAELLMSTDFCDMAYLTKTLNIDSNDVPLLMAIATTHTPQISLRYGVSFR